MLYFTRHYNRHKATKIKVCFSHRSIKFRTFRPIPMKQIKLENNLVEFHETSGLSTFDISFLHCIF
jgi:hypothetical protein